jgi:hypothetical protein
MSLARAEAISEIPQTIADKGCLNDAFDLAATCTSLAARLPKASPGRKLLEEFADAISDALDTE